MGRGSRSADMGRVWGEVGHIESRARRRCACSAFLLTGFFATTSLKPRS